MRSLGTCELKLKEGGALLLRPVGEWSKVDSRPAYTSLVDLLKRSPQLKSVFIDTKDLGKWDSSLLSFLLKVDMACKEHALALDLQSIPGGLGKMLLLATAVAERKGAARKESKQSFVATIGDEFSKLLKSATEIVTFLGDSFLVLISFFRGRTSMRWGDFMLIIEESGPKALPIVTLISLLVGLILAFIGAVQLAQFGAQIYVANLVGIAMMREMGAVMAGIILAGRTGAAYAAELGTMQVNEEIDALKTSGISPMEFLVLPRMLSLMIMMPLLCLYADAMGILGGAIVSIGALDLSGALYWQQTWDAIKMSDFLFGLTKSVVFGVLVAMAGCLRGMQSGRDSAAVGQAATSAVVTSIVLLVVTDAIFAVIANFIGV